MNRFGIFSKMVGMLLLLLVPVLVAFVYSNQAGIGVVKEEIGKVKLSQLALLASQIDGAVNQLGTNAVMLSRNTVIRQYQREFLDNRLFELDKQKTKEAVRDLLQLQSLSSTFEAVYTIYFPSLSEYVSSAGSGSFDLATLQQEVSGSWHYREDEGTYVLHVVEPYAATADIREARMLVEVQFSDQALTRLLQAYERGGEGEPFWFSFHHPPVAVEAAQLDRVRELQERLRAEHVVNGQYTASFTLQGEAYLVSVFGSRVLPWYVVDTVPLAEVLVPLTQSRHLFILTLALLFLFGLLAAAFFYREVQLPIRKLVNGLQSVKKGHYAVRLTVRSRNEFGFLFERFNEMAERIEHLVERVWREEIRTREATLKQLQAQINPHFLYNCLAFVMSMGKMKQHEAVVAMAFHLGKYYRYTTRLSASCVKLSDELELIRSYLNIQQMRMPRLQVQLEVPECLLDVELPLLTLQPLVENAILHGVEPQPGAAWIRMEGRSVNGCHELRVLNSGALLEQSVCDSIHRQIQAPLQEETGFGLWNVQQRMRMLYGPQAGLRYEPLAEGGVCATLFWKEKGGEAHELSPAAGGR